MWEDKKTVRELFKDLGKKNKEAIALLGMGTFLEYFDLMLFVHMAVILEKEFFPQNDPHVSAILGASAFCATFVFRPLGALIFGWIGDNIGRRYTVTLTAFISGFICLVMAMLPSSHGGMKAFWIVLGCRIVQGMVSLGEVIGAMIYLTETIKSQQRYVAVCLMNFGAELGGWAALLVSFFATHTALNWRFAFLMGATAAAMGSLARMRLRETPEFLAEQEARMLEKQTLQKEREGKIHKQWLDPQEAQNDHPLDTSLSQNDWNKIPWKTCLAYLGLECPTPFAFFLIYLHFNPYLKNLGYMAEDVVTHNFTLSFLGLFTSMLGIYLCVRIHPLKIIKTRGQLGTAVLLLWLLLNPDIQSIWGITCLQILLALFHLNPFPAHAALMRAFPVGKRFTSVCLLFAISRALMHIISSFGLIYLTEWFGARGILIVAIPLILAFFWGLKHFQSLHQDRVIGDLVDDMGFVPFLPKKPG